VAIPNRVGDNSPPPPSAQASYDIANISTPDSWARTQLQYMGLPVTSSNVAFLVSWAAAEGGNWRNSATFNPLNTTQREPGSQVMFGGNSAGVQAYTSWQMGLSATANTLNNGFYPQIMAALRSGNASAYNASGSLNGNLRTWGTGSVPANTSYGSITSPGVGGGANAGGTSSIITGPGAPAQVGGGAPGGTTPGGGGAMPAAPPITNIPALDAYIRQNYPQDAWLLDVPEVRRTIETAVSQGLSTDQVQAQLQQTGWWKRTSQAQIAFLQLQHQTPEELNFNDPGSKISSVLANVTNIGSTIGFPVNTVVGRTVALEAMRYGWSNQQIQTKLGSLVHVMPTGPGANVGVTSNDPQVLAQLTKAAGTYLVNPNFVTLNTYANRIARGAATEADWEAYLKGQAAAKYPSMAGQIAQGMTPEQIVDPLRQDAARLMEVSPDAINFIADPTYARILTYRPPDAGGKVQPIRTMTNSEMETYLRGTGAYGYTQNARNDASDLTQSILTTLGKVAG
jgi:hypothetical protein